MADGDGEDQVTGAHSGAHSVFVSYASSDGAVALSVCEALERVGVNCWIAPRDVTPGTFYADEIVHAIDAAKAVVLILSRSAAASPHVLREVERATSKRHPVVALRIDQAPLPAGLEYFLNTSHWLDTSGREIARVMPKLVAAVRLAIQVGTTGDASTTATAIAGTPSRTSYPSKAERTRRRMTIVAGCLLVVAIAGYAAFRSWQPAHRVAAPAPVATAVPSPVPPAPPIPEKSVAVLPFVDMSEKRDQEYFSDGLSEELIDMLTKVPDLRVPARTSSFYFKGKQATIADIGKALNVSKVLEGSVRKSGSQLRITAQLIRVADGYHIWSQTYDRKLDDIFKIQNDIASAVVSTLRASLTSSMTGSVADTGNADSYDLLQQARYFLLRSTPEDQKKAVEYYQHAVEADPRSAAAWAGLSRATAGLNVVGLASAEDVLSTALLAAERAVSLDPKLSEAHVALGKISFNLHRDYSTAKREFDRARILDPESSVTIYWTAVIAAAAGDFVKAIQLLKEAIARDPLDGEIYFEIGQVYHFAGRLPEAETALRKAIDLVPARPGLHSELGIVLLARGQGDAALHEIARETDADARATALACAYHILGREAESQSALKTLEAERGNSAASGIAQIYASHGNLEQTLAWLDRAYHQQEYLMNLKVDPWFKSARDDPRFKALLHRMNLPE